MTSEIKKYVKVFPFIDDALKNGANLHAFRSGGGLRVVAIKIGESLLGYGEHPNLEPALEYANEDIKCGTREYKDVYGKIYPHYLTGTHDTTSPFDLIILQGNNIDAYSRNKKIIVEIRELRTRGVPDIVKKLIDKDPSRPVRWKDSRILFEAHRIYMADNSPAISWKVLKSPNKQLDTHFKKVIRTGIAETLYEAMENALKDNEMEVLLNVNI